ncbi:hypothetical protein PVAP13_5KG373514 [Panicum virgatum]|uniref:DUF4220 domain-containing protein n=1 Tax=Panicum virgatum TaxID=38727 RepID=A0A8T0SM56_PANVG|nr:hypothetical protein PVAP13_5KG373514 [Panicum virgatum]
MVSEALNRFDLCLAFLMGMASMRPRPPEYSLTASSVLRSEKERTHVCYKLTEIQLSLVYDYLYTKFGSRFMHLLQLVTFSSTFTALVLFARAHHHHKGPFHDDDNKADVIVSYILLIGAVILDVLSIFFAVSSYYWCWETLFSLLHPESRQQWSGKLAQESFIGPCIKRKRAIDRGVVRYLMYLVLVRVKGDTVAHIGVSDELKKLLFGKLVDVAGRTSRDNVWDCSKFTSQWAKLELRSKRQGRSSSAATLWNLLSESAERPGFMSTVLAWHVATERCLYHDEGTSRQSPILCRELSNYIMYLTSKHGIISGGEGLLLLDNARNLISDFLVAYKKDDLDLDDPSGAITKIITENAHKLQGDESTQRPGVLQSPQPALVLAFRLQEELMKMNEASDRWEVIANVWMEMLCYMALHCEAAFHAHRLSTGGEFLTHVNVLIYDLGLPYSTYFSEADEESHKTHACIYSSDEQINSE